MQLQTYLDNFSRVTKHKSEHKFKIMFAEITDS